MPDLHTGLGAGPPSGALQITLFVPSVDHARIPIDQDTWREEALRTLGTLSGAPRPSRPDGVSGGTTAPGSSCSTTP